MGSVGCVKGMVKEVGEGVGGEREGGKGVDGIVGLGDK